jgi:hypothetical protein
MFLRPEIPNALHGVISARSRIVARGQPANGSLMGSPARRSNASFRRQRRHGPLAAAGALSLSFVSLNRLCRGCPKANAARARSGTPRRRSPGLPDDYLSALCGLTSGGQPAGRAQARLRANSGKRRGYARGHSFAHAANAGRSGGAPRLSSRKPSPIAQLLHGGHAISMIADRVGNPTDRKALQRFATVTDAHRSAMAISHIGANARDPQSRASQPAIVSMMAWSLNTGLVDMSAPLSHPCIGRAGHGCDELQGRQNPGRRDDVGRHGAPT